MIHKATLNEYGTICESCMLYIKLLIIMFTLIIAISSGCLSFYLRKKKMHLTALYY